MNLKKIFFHFFTPQESNNYKAKTLQIDFLSFYLMVALLLAFTVKNIGPYVNNVLGFATDITTPKLFELSNKEREKQSLQPLQYNKELAEAAQKKAADMFTKDYWAHFAPDGTTPWSFILSSGYQYEYAGENLAKNFLFSQGVVDAWMNSPTHRENILRKEYTEVGYGIVNGVLNGEETTLVVQMLGTPINKSLSLNKQDKIFPQDKQVQAVLGQDSIKPKINLLPFSINGTYVFIFFFSLVLIADFYIATKLYVVKIGGKHMAHLIFLGFILLSIVFIIKNGAIL
ncbi:hypothetical protein HZC27_02340 [Candidatus Roizmanbacteria bacterium]|nr:hypothetical protein [Candidatus Roizmanbacteria bacterium]